MKKNLLMLFTVLFFASCSDEDKVPTVDPVQDQFTEGKIDIDISMEGSPALSLLIEIYRQIDPSRDMDEQMEEIIAGFTEEELAALMEFEDSFDENGDGLGQLGYMMSIMFMPLIDNVVYVKGDEALAKFEALTYRGENKINKKTLLGQYYMQSRWNEANQLSFTYTEEDFSKDFAQTSIDGGLYNIQRTQETELVAGYLCRKHVYTGKSVETAPYKLEVWTSEQMPASVNFLHPYYLEEDGGIMKINAYLVNGLAYPIVYQFTEVTPRIVTAQEMSITETEPIYSYKDDEMTIAFQMFAILFGEGED
ncbi:hypothetical protein ACFSKL_09310 [Belliella marina]|uniref:Uncharacterized protein n=1 Tax=Belliella marina TaxID=1644146 RepID=A0ABW4VM05_9BACT